MSHEQKFDYVIVGGGTTGSVLANRLSANPKNNVLLIEAGADTPEGNIPPEILTAYEPWLPRQSGSRFIWPDLLVNRSARVPGLKRGSELYEQGRILGGGSSVNMTVANRGLPLDYDEWESLGAQGWGWKEVLPYFRKLEHDVQYGNTELHGNDGPLPITRVDEKQWTKFTRSSVEALESIGLTNIHDQNGRFEDGYFSPTFTARNGERVSAARAYLDPSVRARKNLEIWTSSRALRLLVKKTTVYGVEVVRGDSVVEVHANEVILAAGALQSPAFLLRAGIGSGAHLHELQIPVVADRPGVGQNLWDHSSLAVTSPLSALATEDARLADGALPHQLGIRLSSGVDKATPSDLFLHIGANPAFGAATSVFWINKPSSKGSLRLRTANPDDYPEIDFNLLSDTRDVQRLRVTLHTIDKLFKYPSLAKYGLQWAGSPFAQPQGGGPALSALLADEKALEQYLRETVSGVWHASGTARIGLANDPQAVVDSAGKVFGVHGLRVADTSIMPAVPRANTNLPALMVAEKIADAVLNLKIQTEEISYDDLSIVD